MSVGDWVLARDANQAMVFRQVTDEIVIRDAALVYLTIEHADGRIETIETTDEHPFWVDDGTGFTRADELVPGDVLKAADSDSLVRSISISGDRATVYNLTVDDVSTYLVGPDGVWVHNCKVTGVMKSRSARIAKGVDIRKINDIIRVWGGKKKAWRKMKAESDVVDGLEVHWYEKNGQVFGPKPVGTDDLPIDQWLDHIE